MQVLLSPWGHLLILVEAAEGPAVLLLAPQCLRVQALGVQTYQGFRGARWTNIR